MARKITTLDGLRSELMKLVGKRGRVSVGLHRMTSYEPGHRYESESWDANVCIRDAEGVDVVSACVFGDTATDVVLKMKAKIRDELERSALHVEGPPQRRSEYSGGVQ